VIESEGHLCCVKLGHWIREPLTEPCQGTRKRKEGETDIRPPQEGEQFSSRYIVHDHVQIRVVLKSTPEVDDERMLNSL